MVSDIIHAGIYNGSIQMYVCNWACGYHLHKIDLSWKNVTCKNCLNIISKYNRSEKDGCIMLGSRKGNNKVSRRIIVKKCILCGREFENEGYCNDPSGKCMDCCYDENMEAIS